MTHCFVGIGSNENPEYHCQAMIEALRQQFRDIWVSSLCRTVAHGLKAADYVNGVVYFESELTPKELKSWCRQLEDSLGRIRGGTLCRADLDILFMSERVPDLDKLPAVDSYYRLLVKQIVYRIFFGTDDFEEHLPAPVYLPLSGSTVSGNQVSHLKSVI